MGLNPFFWVNYNGTDIPTYSEELCHETQGDCMKWINSYIKIIHNNGEWQSNRTIIEQNFDAFQCKKDSINGYEGYSENMLFICGPTEKIKIYSNYNLKPNIYTGFIIKANAGPGNRTKVYDVINNLQINRASVYQQSDLKSMKANPIDKSNRFLGKF